MADQTGLWKVIFPPQQASLSAVTISFSANVPGDEATATLTNVLFGEVLFCSGQSNVGNKLLPVPVELFHGSTLTT